MRHILRNRTIFPPHFIYHSFSNAKTTCEPLFARRENFRKFIPQPALQNELNPLLTPPSTGVRKFATMVILVDFPIGGKEKAGTYVLLTHRAAKMKKHANEISVPGGENFYKYSGIFDRGLGLGLVLLEKISLARLCRITN
ncbi:unnamed protein product [Meloidogyne enterolobii]|uniref:Uncharacterized protein n=1 Tax=Meloidogyne enterolobii TaxID=390850 RepID=A0ACB0ZSH7_MELEN